MERAATVSDRSKGADMTFTLHSAVKLSDAREIENARGVFFVKIHGVKGHGTKILTHRDSNKVRLFWDIAAANETGDRIVNGYAPLN